MDWQFNISIGHKSIGIWQTHNLTWIHLKLANSVMQNGHLIRNGHLYRIDQIIFIDQLNNPGNMGLSRIILAQTWSWQQGGGGGPGPGVGGPEEEGEEGSRSAMEEGGVHHLWLQEGLQYLIPDMLTSGFTRRSGGKHGNMRKGYLCQTKYEATFSG